MSKQRKDVEQKTQETKTTSNQIKQQFINFTKSSKRKLQALNVKNKLKVNAFKHKINGSEMDSQQLRSPITMQANPSELRFLNRVTTVFSGGVIIGLSALLIYMAQPIITDENFTDKMQDSITAAFNYDGTDLNTSNGKIAYHIPRQFQYRWSLGVNDILKYKKNEIIMHYNEQYNIIGQDTDTYYLLRDENKAAGEEVFYKNFNMNDQNGFVQLVEMPDSYLLTVFVDGTKLSAIIDYEEAPYLVYNMLVVGRSVEAYESMTLGTQVVEKSILPGTGVTTETADSQVTPATTPTDTQAESKTTSATDDSSAQTPAGGTPTDGASNTTTDTEGVVEGELSTVENEQVIQFDFSSEKRSEVTSSESGQ